MIKQDVKKFLVYILLLSFVLFPVSTLRAAVLDSDQDGLSDSVETEVYQTNPNESDTDKDSVSDGQEILEGTNPTDDQDSTPRVLETQEEIAQQDFFDSNKLAWYIGRSAGIAAFILFTVSIVNGLFMSTRTIFPSWPTFLSYETHRTLAWTAFSLLLLHIVSFVFDSYLHLSFLEALIPGFLQRSFRSTLGFQLTFAIALGIIAFYLICIVSFTAEFRSKLPLKWWRKIHFLSFLAYLTFLVHGITSGSDSRQWWMIWIYGISAVLVGGLTLFRIILVIRKPKTTQEIPSQTISPIETPSA